MADEGFIITVVGAIVTTIISVVILRSLKFFEKNNERKAEEVKETARLTALAAQENAKQIAEELNRKNEERSMRAHESNSAIAEELRRENALRDQKVAEEIKTNISKISEDVKQVTANIAQDLQKKTDEQSKVIVNNIASVNERLTGMIDALKKGADLTNENVSKIRNDMYELQQDVDDIYDKINHDDIANDPAKKSERDRKRKIRKKELTNDSILSAGDKSAYSW